MKKVLSFFLMAFVAVSLNGCSSSDEPISDPDPVDPTVEVTLDAITGEWILSGWSGGTLPSSSQIYLKVNGDNTFDLYQKNVNYAGVTLFEGTYTFNEANALISGKYDDGTDWSSSYTITATSNTMTWKVADGSESSTFTRQSIPAEIIDVAVPADEVRSAELFRLL